MTCPTCGSHDISKNGTTRRGKQNYKCRDCNRQFVEDPQWKPKDKDTRSLVDLLLLEKIPLADIARAIDVSDSCYRAVTLAIAHLNQGSIMCARFSVWPCLPIVPTLRVGTPPLALCAPAPPVAGASHQRGHKRSSGSSVWVGGGLRWGAVGGVELLSTSW